MDRRLCCVTLVVAIVVVSCTYVAAAAQETKDLPAMTEMFKQKPIISEDIAKIPVPEDQEFPFKKSYKWEANVTIDPLGQKKQVLNARGSKTFEFYSIQEKGRAGLRLTDMVFNLSDINVVLTRRDQSGTQTFHIPKLTIGPESVDMKGSKGFVDLETGMFSLEFKILISPKIIPALENYGIKEDIPIFVSETGKLDLKDDEYQSEFRFDTDSGYKGDLLIGFWGCKNCGGCDTETSIRATLGASSQEKEDVYICPGEDVYLWWVSSSDVDSVTITPDVGNRPPDGHLVVNPTTTTEYEITTEGGECVRSDEVRVHVIEEGEDIEMIAYPKRDCGCWEFKMPETTCSRNIIVTAIEPMCAIGCFAHYPPILNYRYMSCGDLRCNGWWAVSKEDIDGHLRSFNIPIMRINIPDYPLTGTWQFVPEFAGNLQGNAYFKLWVKCE